MAFSFNKPLAKNGNVICFSYLIEQLLRIFGSNFI